jgi:hypothetical protein
MSQRGKAGFNPARFSVGAGDEVEAAPAASAALASVSDGEPFRFCLPAPLTPFTSRAAGVGQPASAAICDSGTPLSVGLGGSVPRLWSCAVGVAQPASCAVVGRSLNVVPTWP